MLSLLVFAWSAQRLSPTAAQQIATAETAARISVKIPPAVKGTVEPVMLDLVVKAFRNPTMGNIGGVVRIKRPGAANGVEIGRFSIFPSRSFNALDAADEKRFRFDVTSELKRIDLTGDMAEVEVELIERSNGKVPADTALVIGGAHISPD